MIKAVALVLLGLAATGSAQNSFQCPHDFGFYPHESFCDKYYACDESQPTLKTCGNGLQFDATDPEYFTENCDYMNHVDCTGRPENEPPISTPNCEYLYGIFTDANDCSVFWSCWDGEASKYSCAPGLAYDPRSRVCTWMDKVPECAQKRENMQQGFVCPAPGELAVTGAFSRHPHPEDCRQFFVCLDGNAREYGCPLGTVFNIGDLDGTGQCDDSLIVPGCENYYGDLDLNNLSAAQVASNRADSHDSQPRAPTPRRTTTEARNTVQPIVDDEEYDDDL